MRRWLMVVFCLASMQGWAQYSGYKPVNNAESFRLSFTKASQATQSIQCGFVQEKNLRDRKSVV